MYGTVKVMKEFLNAYITIEETMNDLKAKTIIDDNIIFDGNFYRYVNHNSKLLTTGFRVKNGLTKNKDIIRFDKLTILTMRDRYDKFYRS